MKKILGVIGVAAAMTMSGGIASAGPNDATVNVSFPFIVGNTELPAGTYVVKTSTDASGAVSVESADHRTIATTLTIEHESENQTTQPELVFKKYGDHYFLARVTSEGTDREVALTPSLMEHAIAATSWNELALVGKKVPVN